MKTKQITIFGATGLIGSLLLDLLIEDDTFTKIIIVYITYVSRYITFTDLQGHQMLQKHYLVLFALHSMMMKCTI